MSAFILVDLIRVEGTFELAKKHSYSEKDYNEVLLKGSMNFCNMAKGMRGNFIINMIMDNLKDFSNFQFSCPTKKGFYHYTDFPIVNDKYLPHFLSAEDRTGYWQFAFNFKGKFNGTKLLVNILKVKICGSRAISAATKG